MFVFSLVTPPPPPPPLFLILNNKKSYDYYIILLLVVIVITDQLLFFSFPENNRCLINSNVLITILAQVIPTLFSVFPNCWEVPYS